MTISRAAPSRGATTACIAKIPYLNTVPFFRGTSWEERYQVIECVPRELGRKAAAGEVTAGLLPVADCFRLEGRFERLGHFGIAVRGRVHSVLLFSRRPLKQLDGAVIAVTEETSTSAVLLRLLLEQRYRVIPAGYERRLHPERRRAVAAVGANRRQDAEADAVLLIGDEALRFRQANAQYPFEIDVAFEWWLWQHLPFVFAVWAVRKDAPARDKQQIEAGLAKSLAANLAALDAIGQEHSASLKVPAETLTSYLGGFQYRLGPMEDEGIARFRELVDGHHLL